MEKIRLVIWDLDETFWNGTLSEGDVQIPDEHKKIIIELAKRGIMSSVSSKNDEADVKEKLEKEHLWEYFVFPRINWENKGIQVKAIIESMKLRPESVMFIDDNPTNRGEVSYYNPKVEVFEPTIIKSILEMPEFLGKDDRELSRLKQYKILEKKQIDETKIGDNEEFLYKSNIQVDVITESLESFIDRIEELNQRTNQLNYTKNRQNRESILKLLKDTSYHKGVVSVKDNYGDYGIVGFYAIKNNTLEHFYFSCRTLGLAVEQWVYAKLGFPDITVVGDVAVELNPEENPKWINSDEVDIGLEEQKINLKMLILGGCDLRQTAHYLKKSGLNIVEKYNYVVNERFDCHTESSEIIKQSETITEQEKNEILEVCPFYDNNVFDTSILHENYDVIVYSPLIDFTYARYCMKSNPKIKVLYGNYDYPNLMGYNYMTSEERDRFRQFFDFEGLINPEDFKVNLELLRKIFSPTAKILILNSSEQNFKHPYEKNRYIVHKQFNEIIEQFSNMYENVYLIDVKKMIEKPADHTDNIRHYTREKYFEIAQEIMSTIKRIGLISEKESIEIQNKDIKNPLKMKIKILMQKMGLLSVWYRFKFKDKKE